ncbi:unnamed protein product [Ceutorhynchus assimilis]|uniref:Heat shock protein 70 n=1 Tax=Ceutorhynchus assimilis TaxID=467358 RepID=A0A9N9MQ65_9CUCU|nr:unnamed protein product [Ceutorhynchus assimilis]
MSLLAIGIDLGTTYTVAAIYKDGHPEIIPNLDKDRLTSSIVFYSPKDRSAIVGKYAYDKSIMNPRNVLFDMKRIIGRDYKDAYVQNYVAMGQRNTFNLQVTCNSSGPCIKLDYEGDETNATVTPEEVASDILKHVKLSAERFLGQTVNEAVISVPAYFSYAQRAATKRAAEQVGFQVLKLITEPVAAAIHYTKAEFQENMLLLVVDLGGGTLDVSVIRCTRDRFEVKAIEGDMFLGGNDFDEVVFNHLLAEISQRYVNKKAIQNPRFVRRLRKYAKKLKEALSTHKEYNITVEMNSDDVYEIEMTREKFEQLTDPLFQRITNKVQKCIQSAKITTTDIDKVVLTGGASMMPKLTDLIKNIFDIEPSTNLHPDEAVALGASIHAAHLKHNLENSIKYELIDVAPHSLGIQTQYDLMIGFIEKGATLPAISKKSMQTSYNNQNNVIFKIFEGERKQCKRNKKLGQLTINDLPLGKAGEVEFEVTFVLDENGVLLVTAVEKSTGNQNQLQIMMNNLALCDSDLYVPPEKENELAREDILWDEYYRFLIGTDRYCDKLICEVEKLSFSSRKDNIIKALNDFNERKAALNHKNIELLKNSFQLLHAEVSSDKNSIFDL